MIRAVLVGATGRMGQAIIAAAHDSAGIAITAAVASRHSTCIGRDAGELAGGKHLGVRVSNALREVLSAADVVIDFSTASATEEHLAACRAAKKPLLVGTTEHSAAQQKSFAAASLEIPLLVAPNTSLAVTLLLELARQAALALPFDFDIEIIEAHHRAKSDAPSGTALALGQAVAQARAQELAEVGVMNGRRDTLRRSGDIGFAVVRGGDLIGEHSVLYAGPGESLTLTHRATDRGIFARGALNAAVWLSSQPHGLYSMRDIFLYKTGS
ncbi:MAG TPA: 4-hydroxy-tetrahydrodipicolinate reductase [Steroidobacteraceae bacterium]